MPGPGGLAYGRATMPLQLVGRTQELGAAVTALADPGLRGVLLTGEAGIGKSAVWRAAADQAGAQGARVLRARPREAEAPLAFSALEALLGPVVDDVLPHLPGPQARALAAALLLEESDAPPDERAVGTAVASSLRALARSDQVVAAIDDVPWVDAASAAALEFAVGRLGPGDQIRLLLARRTGDPGSAGGFTAAAADGEVRRIDVGPLSAHDLQQLVELELGRRLSRPLVVRLHEMSRGNALHALELARALDDEQLAGRAPVSVPDELGALLRRRIAGLPAATRAALLPAALLGDPTTDRLDAALPGVSAGLADAHAAGIVELDRGAIRFTHPLLAAAVVGSVPSSQVRAVHRAIAAATGDRVAAAHHAGLGADGPDAAIAQELEAAAELAEVRGGLVQAAELAELAARLTPAGDTALADARRVVAARRLVIAGDDVRARTLLEDVLERAEGTLRAEALLNLADTTIIESFEDSSRMYREALEAAGDDHALRAEILIATAMTMSGQGDLDGALRNAQEAVREAEQRGASDELVALRTLVALLETYGGRPPTPGLLEHALAGPRLAWTAAYQHPQFVLASRLMLLDRYDEARERFGSVLREARALGSELIVRDVLFHSMELEIRAGRLEVAADFGAQHHELAALIGGIQPGGTLHADVYLASATGDLETVRALGPRAVALCEEEGDWIFVTLGRAAIGHAELSAGDAAAAAAVLDGLPDALVRGGWQEPTIWRLWPDAVEAQIALGHLDEADRLMRLWEPLVEATGSPQARGTIARAEGLLAAARGEVAAALGRFDASLEAFGDASPIERARTLLARGLVLRRAKRRAEAREALEAARDAFKVCGARQWAATAEAELARIGGRRAAGSTLTATESRVAELVVEGRSNKEIAATLYVSVRAVEANLTRIYAKLGVRSRTELAGRLAAARG